MIWLDDAHLLGDGDELVGWDPAVLGVMPTGQRLHVHDPPGPDVGDGVVHHAQLGPALEGVRQQTAEHEDPLHALVVLHRVELVTLRRSLATYMAMSAR